MTVTAGEASRASPSAAPSGGGANSITYGNSWAEDVQKYRAAKATLPWQPEQQAPVTLVTRYEKSRQEREYDPVLGKFRDANKELKAHDHDASKRKHDLEHSRARQLRNVQRFNLINHSPMYTGARDPQDPASESRPPPRRTSNANYNIVTNIPRDGLTSPASSGAPLASPTTLAAQNRRVREFNILSNKFHDRHDQREREDNANAKQLAAVKFAKRNTFHPVRVAFFDPAKETAFLADRDAEQRSHGKDRVAKLPPRAQFAEGNVYNILTQNVINPSQIQRYDGHVERAQSQRQQHAFETRMLALGQQLAERDDQLCLNRYAHERHAQSFVHGFDPITNEPFDGIQAKPRVATRTHAALPAWHVLEQGIPLTSKIAVQQPRATESIKTPPIAEHRGDPSGEGTAERRPNVLVVDRPAKTGAPARNTSTIRVGGFGHASR